MNKNMNARITLKHDTEENWLKAVNFTPMDGELIIYDIDEAHDYKRAKVGDGVTNVNLLPWFVGEKVDIDFSIYAIKEEVEAALASLNTAISEEISNRQIKDLEQDELIQALQAKIEEGLPVEFVGF